MSSENRPSLLLQLLDPPSVSNRLPVAPPTALAPSDVPSATVPSATVPSATVPSAAVPTATVPFEPIKTRVSKRKESSDPLKDAKKPRKAHGEDDTWIELHAVVATHPDEKMTKQEVLDRTLGCINFYIDQLPGGTASLATVYAAFLNSQQSSSSSSTSSPP